MPACSRSLSLRGALRIGGSLGSSIAFAIPAGANPSVPPEFADAPAVVLEDRTSVLLTPTDEILRRKRRILIRSRRGYDMADSYFVYDRTNTAIRSFEARTVLPDGRVEPVPADLMHDITAMWTETEWHRARQFTFPAVRPDAILEFEYELVRSEHYATWEWPVQDRVPVLDATFEIRSLGEELVGDVHFAAYNRGTSTSACRAMKPEKRGARKPLLFGVRCESLPGIAMRPHAPPEPDRRVAFTISASRVGPVAENLLRNAVREHWIARMQECAVPSDALRERARLATEKAVGPVEKIASIYELVQRSTHPDATIRTATRCRSPEEVLASGAANRTESAMLLVALLQAVDLPVSLVAGNDRTRRRFDPAFPDLDQFRELLVFAGEGASLTVLDPGCRRCPTGLVGWERCGDGAGGLRIDPSTGRTRFVDLAAPRADRTRTSTFLRLSLLEEGGAVVELQRDWDPYEGIAARKWLEEGSAEELLRSTFARWDLDEEGALAEWIGREDPGVPLRARLRSRLEGAGLPTVDGLALFPPRSFLEEVDLPLGERSGVAYWWEYPRSAQTIATFALPSGYRAASLPDGVDAKGPGVRFQASWERGGRAEEVVWRGTYAREWTFAGPEREIEYRQFLARVVKAMRTAVILEREEP